MFVYCTACRRYYWDTTGHVCPAPPPKPKPVWKWKRPWHVTTAADRKIARKFAHTKTQSLWSSTHAP